MSYEIKTIDGKEFILKHQAYSYGIKGEIEAVIDEKISYDELSNFLNENCGEIADYLADLFQEWRENQE